MLMQCHDHYNSHGDGSDAYTVTRDTDDELSESGRLRNKLNMSTHCVYSAPCLIVSSMPCISRINFSSKTMRTVSDEREGTIVA